MKTYLKKYKQIRKLGQGAYGKVYLVKDTYKGQQFALKKCDKKIFNDMTMKEALQNQIKCLKYFSCMANCQNIIKFQHFAQDQKFLYIIAEYCDEGDLRSVMSKLPNKLFTLPQALQILSQVINGLEMIHSLKYMHRDIKLQNILLKNQNGKKIAKICDFGFSSKFNHSNRRTVAGTPNYMAPEVYECDENEESQGYNFEVDMWSFGVLFFYMLNAQYPFSIQQGFLELPEQYSYKKATANISKITNNDRIEDLQDLFLKIFKKNPKERLTFYQIRSHPLFKPYFPNIKEKTKKLYDTILENVLMNFIPIENNQTKMFKIVNYEIKKIQFLEDCFKILWKAPFLLDDERYLFKYQSLKYFLIQYQAFLMLLNAEKLSEKYISLNWQKFCCLQNFQSMTKNMQQKLIQIFNTQYVPTHKYCQDNIENLVRIRPTIKKQLTKSAREDALSDDFKIIYRETLNQVLFDKLKMYKKSERLSSYYYCTIAQFCNSYHHGIFDRIKDIKIIFAEFLYSQQVNEPQDLNFQKLKKWLENNKHQSIFVRIITKINENYF